MEDGNWFLTGKDYFALSFWGGPFYFTFRIYEDGASGLYEVRTLKDIDTRQKKALDGILPKENRDSASGNYKTKHFSKAGENPLTGLQKFLEIERKAIDEAVQKNPTKTLDIETGEVRGLRMLDDIEFQTMLATVLEFRERRKKTTLLPPIKPAKPKPGEMPIALESLIVRNFQGIEKTELIGLPRAPWIFLTGNNGYGKSCVLRATFIGFHGKRDGDTELANGGTDIVLRYWDDEKVVTNSSAEAQSPSIAAYGPHRLEITDEISKEQRTDRSSASFSLFKTSGHLLNIEGYLRDWYTDPKRKSRYTTVVEMLKSLMPGIGDIFFDEDSRRILYCEKDTETGENLPPLDFLKLASGFKSIIAFVGDMCIRFFESNPSWSATHDFKGIVIVDELDLHLHPIWQRQLPTLLSTAFPKVQFIVSTHSPIPILGAPAGSILLTVDRTKEEGTQVERLDIDISTLLPNTILTSPIFGFQEIMPQSFDKRHQRIRTEASFQEKIGRAHV